MRGHYAQMYQKPINPLKLESWKSMYEEFAGDMGTLKSSGAYLVLILSVLVIDLLRHFWTLLLEELHI